MNKKEHNLSILILFCAILLIISIPIANKLRQTDEKSTQITPIVKVNLPIKVCPQLKIPLSL